jgi:S1-C subfamily serine protease/predicted esterase
MPWRRPLLLSILAAALCARPAAAQADLNEELEKMVKAAVRKVSPAVVQIVTQGGSDVVVTDPKKGTIFRKALGPTTGLVVDADGYVITSTYNFANKPTTILVNVPDRTEPLVARKVAEDKSRMLTLLKIDATGLAVPSFVSKKEMQEGQWSIALGRTLDAKRGAPPSISLGVVSAKNRIWGKAIQTDAKVSPVNYGGPLVDIQGRVQGVIIPASPFVEDVNAGFEWYDSGIGFAVPLEDVMAVLPRLKSGKDLDKGVLGFTTKSADLYAALPEIAAVQKDSAADRAGLKPGDIITEVDGQPVKRMAQIRHLLGTKYEGDKVSLKYKRGEEEKSAADVVLVSVKQTAAHAFLGILPMRDDPALGVEVRYVFAKTPADKAGLAPGDRIVKYGPATAKDDALTSFTGLKRGRVQLQDWLNGLSPGADVQIEVKRKGGKTEKIKLQLDQMPGSRAADEATVPEKLPQPASLKKGLAPLELLNPNAKPAKVAEQNPPKAQTGTLKRTTADGQHTYWVHVPKNYDADVAHAMVVWLHPPGKFKEEDVDDFVDLWDDFCKDQHMILLVPLTQADSGWTPSDSAFVAEAMKAVLGEYAIDRQRVVTHGLGVGGQMAIYLGFTERDTVHGVATVGAVVMQALDGPRDKRLSFYVAGGAVDPIIKSIAEGRARLVEKSYPVVYREIPNRGREYLEEAQLRELVRWIDSLDKL